jgi:hypothetical protein
MLMVRLLAQLRYIDKKRALLAQTDNKPLAHRHNNGMGALEFTLSQATIRCVATAVGAPSPRLRT